MYGSYSGMIWHDYYKWVSAFGYLLELGYPTDPNNADTDGDGYDDKTETDQNSDPNDASAIPLDRSAPTVNITEPNSSSTRTTSLSIRIAGTAIDNKSPVAVVYRVKSPSGQAYGSPQGLALQGTQTSKNWHFDLPLSQKGVWSVQIFAADAVGNRSQIRSVTILAEQASFADTKRPSVGITSSRTVRTAAYTLKARLSDNVAPVRVDYRVRRPNGNFGRWISKPLSGTQSVINWSESLNLGRRGTWQIQVRAFDSAGNASRTDSIRVNRRR
jgi:hypothetical protein